MDGAKIMTISLVAAPDGLSGTIQIGGVDKVVIGAAGITPASLAQKLTLMTAQATTSGISKNFAGIPSWAKRIKILFSGVSLSGTSSLSIWIGDAGGVETTGYSSTSGNIYNTGSGIASSTSAFFLNINSAAITLDGVIELINISGNTWVCSGVAGSPVAGAPNLIMVFCTGTKTLSDTLTQITIGSSNLTDTLDAGSINIMYEG